MSLADPHCHTRASDGMCSPRELVQAALERGLDLVGVTDHDTMAAVDECVERGAEAGLAVVPGEEITTAWPAQTHLLAWFLERPVKSGMSLLDTVRAVHEQGALAVIPHPFMPTYFASCQPGMLERLLEQEAVDGIELCHTAPMGWRRRALSDFARRHADRLGCVVGASDSHFCAHDLGSAVTEFEGRGVEDFRRAVVQRTTSARFVRPRSVPLGLAARQQVRSLVVLPFRRLTRQL